MEQIQVEYLYKLKKLRGNMTNSKDVLAKLLSTEDVNVVRAEVPTASFDVKNRVLTLPTFVNVDESVENLMIGHEVGHALWTPVKGVTEEMAKDKLLKAYANVIEDVRIEKMIQAEYPGLRQDFIKGYKKLADDDFFGIGKKDINSLQLIDKINLYFKIGLKSGIKFSKEEFEIVSRVDSCKTFKEVITLAKELSNYSRKKKQEEEEAMKQEMQAISDELAEMDLEEELEDLQEVGGDVDDGESDDETTEEESEESEAGNAFGDQAGDTQQEQTAGEFDNPYDYNDDEELRGFTQDNLDKTMSDHAQFEGKIFRNVEVPEFPFGVDPIIDHKEVMNILTKRGTNRWGEEEDTPLSKMMNDSKFITDSGHYAYLPEIDWNTDNWEKDRGRKFLGYTSGAYYKEDYKNFQESIKKDIDFMVKEFEMKKSAQRYARTQTAKSGQLNVNKLYSYKLTEDLFKRVQVCADDKNHGFIMLVDWSGSMHNVMRDTMRQVITLATFCRKVNIPFQVLAFSNHDNYSANASQKESEQYKKVVEYYQVEKEQLHFMSRSSCWLYELLTHEMSQKDFDEMAFMMHSFMWHYSYTLSLSGTPLTEALECSVGIVGRFIKKHNIDKMNFITLTDGAGYAKGMQDNWEKMDQVYGKGWNGRWKEKIDTLIDPVTKKKYIVSGDREKYDWAYLDMISNRYNCSTVGYFIGRNTYQGIREFAHFNIKGDMWSLDLDKMRATCRKNGGWMSLKDCGRDEMFFLDSKKLNPVSQEIEVDGQKSSAQIARAFSKGMKQNRQSKVLMSTFVERVA